MFSLLISADSIPLQYRDVFDIMWTLPFLHPVMIMLMFLNLKSCFTYLM